MKEAEHDRIEKRVLASVVNIAEVELTRPRSQSNFTRTGYRELLKLDLAALRGRWAEIVSELRRLGREERSRQRSLEIQRALRARAQALRSAGRLGPVLNIDADDVLLVGEHTKSGRHE